MKISKLKKELYNFKLTFVYLTHFGVRIWFWSLVDGIIRRLGFDNFYTYTHKKRYDSCKRYLERNYSFIIDKYKKQHPLPRKVSENSPVWQYWHQGAGKCPEQVKMDLNSLKGKTRRHERIVLDKNSYKEYVSLPPYIEEKMAQGKMDIAVFSDFLRMALLKECGGIWVDSTFFFTNELPQEVDNYAFYSIKQYGKRKWVVTKDLWSVGMLSSAQGGNALVNFCYDFLCEYWKKENAPIGYLMTDCIIAIGYEKIDSIKKLIDDVPNNNGHAFDFVTSFADEPYNKNTLSEMNNDTYLYQLTYKKEYHTSINGVTTNYGGLTNEILANNRNS